LPFFVVGFIYQLVFFLFVVSTPTSTTSQSLVCLWKNIIVRLLIP
jgi:hypothetical protein